MKETKIIKRKGEKGITLIALVVTIVVLLILAGVTITFVLSDGGILQKAREAANKTNNAIANEQEYMGQVENGIGNFMNSNTTNTTPTGPQITVDGQTITLTKENVKNFLGKKVTNFKTDATGEDTVGDSYKVSKTYRLYYVDFENKYRDGEGTVYLKAECTSNSYILPITDTSADTLDNIKIKNLNPELYKSENGGAPSANTNNMKAVTWLLNTNNWDVLKEGVNETTKSKINYIVGAPSLEMMMDSYNMYYNLTESTPNTSQLDTESKRVRLFYKYNKADDPDGYKVGPNNRDDADTYGYGYETSGYSVKTDTDIDTMYYQKYGQYYWLASPSAKESNQVVLVYDISGGFVECHDCTGYTHAFCPVVSLDSSVQLTLEN